MVIKIPKADPSPVHIFINGVDKHTNDVTMKEYKRKLRKYNILKFSYTFLELEVFSRFPKLAIIPLKISLVTVVRAITMSI